MFGIGYSGVGGAFFFFFFWLEFALDNYSNKGQDGDCSEVKVDFKAHLINLRKSSYFISFVLDHLV